MVLGPSSAIIWVLGPSASTKTTLMDSRRKVTLGKLSDFLEKLPNVNEIDHRGYRVKSGKRVVTFTRKSLAWVPEKDREIWEVLAKCSHCVELRPLCKEDAKKMRRSSGAQARWLR